MYITLTQPTRDALDRFTEQTGIASSQLAAQLLDGAVPVIHAMTDAFAIARQAPDKAAGIMHESLTKAMVQAAQLKIDLDEDRRTPKLRRRPRT